MHRLLLTICTLGLTWGCIDRAPVDDPDERAAPPVEQPDAVERPPVDPSPPDRIVSAPDGPVGHGMSWRLNLRFKDQGVVDVGCGSQPGRCDAYDGDMACDVALPILCFNPLDLPEPPGLPPANQYHQWSGGAVELTAGAWAPALDGLTTFADIDAICAADLGTGWRAARFHDGWGWNFRAQGDLNQIDTRGERFWALIDDQPNGNCVRR